MARIDLHIHTTASDGTWSLEQVFDACRATGVSVVAITDHDVLTHVHRLRTNPPDGLIAVAGVEISARDRGRTVHVLGYGLAGDVHILEEALVVLRRSRSERNGEIVKRLNALGIPATIEAIEVIAAGATLGRPHIARWLTEQGYTESIQAAFDEYLVRGAKAHAEKTEISVSEAIRLLHEAGAAAVIAHPSRFRWSEAELAAALDAWTAAGVDGVEVYYSTHDAEQTASFARLARERNLLATAGSDFHGENKPTICLGEGRGALNAPEDLWPALQQRLAERAAAVPVANQARRASATAWKR